MLCRNWISNLSLLTYMSRVSCPTLILSGWDDDDGDDEDDNSNSIVSNKVEWRSRIHKGKPRWMEQDFDDSGGWSHMLCIIYLFLCVETCSEHLLFILLTVSHLNANGRNKWMSIWAIHLIHIAANFFIFIFFVAYGSNMLLVNVQILSRYFWKPKVDGCVHLKFVKFFETILSSALLRSLRINHQVWSNIWMCSHK